MKIVSIEAMRLTRPPTQTTAVARRPAWTETAEVANPMSRYPHAKAHRGLWLP